MRKANSRNLIAILGKKTTINIIVECFLTKKNQMIQRWSSYKGRKENALAPGADEGRDKLRKASGRSKYPLIRGYPNVGTHMSNTHVSYTE